MAVVKNQISSCGSQNFANTGDIGCENTETLIKTILVSKSDFYFDTSSALPTQADIQEAIQQKKLFPLAIVDEIEDQSSEAQVYDATSGQSYTTRDAIKGMMLNFTLSAYEYVNYLTFDGSQVRIFEYDHNGNLRGTDMDGDTTKFAGFLTSRFDVHNRTLVGDATSVVQTPISIKYKDRDEYRDDIWVISDMGIVDDVTGLIDVTVEITDPATDGATFTVTNTATGEGVSNLVAGDFKILDDTGSAITVSDAVESTSTAGEYAISATMTAGTYTGGLQDPADMTTDGYDGGDLVEFTVPA